MARVSSLPLQWRLGLVVLAGLLLVFAPFVWLGSVMAEDSTRQMAAERLEVAEVTASFLDEEFAEQLEDLDTAAVDAAAILNDGAALQRLVSDLLRVSEPFITEAVIIDLGGHVIVTAPPGRTDLVSDLSTEDYVSVPLATHQHYVSGVYAGGRTPRPLVALTAPILAANAAPLGVLVTTLDPTTRPFSVLHRAAAQLGTSGHVELFDQNLRLIATSEIGHALGPAEHPTFYRPLIERHIKGVGLTDPIGDEDPADRGQRHIMAMVPLDSVPWGLGVGGSEAAFTALIDRWRWEILPLGVLVLATVVLLVWTTRRTVVAPVEALTQRAQRIAAGDLTSPVPRLGGGEVRALAEAFEQMRDYLREALEALAVENSRYQGIVESMADAVFTTDLEQRITAFNPAAEVLTGWPASDAVGRQCDEVLCSAEPKQPDQCICSADADDASIPAAAAKHLVRQRDGRALTVALARSSILGRDGALKGHVYVVRDISAEEELDRLKDEFLSTVSHELRTPLGAITGYATTLLAEPELLARRPVARRFLRVIAGASQELHELVDNLLDMSKIGAGALTMEARPVHLRPLARTAFERVRLRARAHEVRIEVPVGLPPVHADPRRIEQVLHNLLDNGLKYTPAGGHVILSAVAVGDEVTVSVADDGDGIPPEDAVHLFERFYRGPAGRAGNSSGTGLGLAICKGIVEAHGGRIWVETRRPGVPGTVIRFTLKAVLGGNGSVRRASRTATATTPMAS
jgi:two-component system phosphate regulon sensor histidine kinase PhoR